MAGIYRLVRADSRLVSLVSRPEMEKDMEDVSDSRERRLVFRLDTLLERLLIEVLKSEEKAEKAWEARIDDIP
jgi:hypothetical protein